MPGTFRRDIQFYRFCLYGFFKNLRFFEAFLVLFFLEKGLTFLAIGTLYAAREITINLFEIPSGIIADVAGRKRTLMLSFVFYIISFVIFFFSQKFGLFFLAMIVFSLGEAFRSGNHKAMIFHYLQAHGWLDQKVHYYGITRSWSQMGSALSALSGAAVVFLSGSYKYIFLFSVIPYVLDLIMVAGYPSFLDGDRQQARWTMVAGRFSEVFKELMNGLRTRRVLGIIGSLSMYSGYYKGIKDYLQPVIATWALAVPFLVSYTEKQRSSLFVGAVFFIVYILSSFASRYSGHFADHYSRLSVPMNITLAVGLAGGILSGFFYTYELWVLSVVFFILVYMIENVRKPIGVAYLSSNVSSNVYASVLSVDSQAQSLGAAVIAPLIGIFADLFGVGWGIVAGTASLLLISPLLYLGKGDKKNENG